MSRPKIYFAMLVCDAKHENTRDLFLVHPAGWMAIPDIGELAVHRFVREWLTCSWEHMTQLFIRKFL